MTKTKKIFFFGTPQIATPSLEAIATLEGVEIVGVGVIPDKLVGRKKILTPCPVKLKARELNLPIVEISNKKDLTDCFENYQFDLGIVIAFGMLFPEHVLNMPEFGVVNVHFSLLPEYRGASPVQSAILDGKNTSGITWQRMVKALDAGDILWQKEYDIRNKNTLQVWEQFAQYTAEEFSEFLQNYLDSKITPIVQAETTATFCGKFEKKDGAINPLEEGASSIYQKFLAFTPWPGIFLPTDKRNLKILECSLESNKGIMLPCKEGEIFIETAQLEGKKPSKMIDILRGAPDLLEGYKK